jgi:hypothetical protein
MEEFHTVCLRCPNALQLNQTGLLSVFPNTLINELQNSAQTLYWILGITDLVYHQLFKEYIKSHIYMLIQLTLFQQHFGS